MTLHLASKCAISTTAYSPVQYATSYIQRFCGKIREIMVNLLNVSELK